MKKRNFKDHQNMKPQQNRQPKFDVVPIMAEIQIPTEEDFIRIPRSEYMGLVANNALLEAVKRMIVADRYDSYSSMRTILNIPKKKEEEA